VTYDDWYMENAPCSTASSRRSRSRSSRILTSVSPTGAWLSMLFWIVLVLSVLALGSALGCGRTVLVTEASPMRVGPMTYARVYHRVGSDWVLSDNRIVIPEGWYLVPPSFVESER
jgi:hypothetical protein